MTFEFTESWFDVSELKRVLPNFVDLQRPLNILEIGCFEGKSTLHFLQQAKHMASRVVAVDPFSADVPIVMDIFGRFLRNMSKCAERKKLKFLQQTSDDFFASNQTEFDLVYVDGDHEPKQAMRDLTNAIKCCKIGGIVWFDDYMLNDLNHHVDALIKTQNVLVIHKSYQLGLKKC